ncbi:MAG: CPBP family intramembrane metalloprotease [Bacillus sp. (in: Bacteria)]|nr:CPBP family intramembrane metalloprotease [Bacillus sp. (in: firmicutes)]
MKKIIQKYSLLSFYVLTLIVSFILLTLHFVFPSVGYFSVAFTQLAPASAVVIITFFLKNKAIVNKIKSQLVFPSGRMNWLMLAFFVPALCIVASSFVLSLLKVTYIPWNGTIMFYILNSAAILVGCSAEEIGWRGFLLPRLQEKHSPFVSSIIVGVLWGIWHFNFTGGLQGFIFYTITIIEMSVLMTWLYNKSNGNLVVMIFWHFIYNLFSHIFLWERFAVNLFIVESIVFGFVCILIVISNRKALFSYQSVRHLNISETFPKL